jgi:hypothetical protein
MSEIGEYCIESSFSLRIDQRFITAVHLNTKLYGIDRLLIIMETCVFCEVGAEYLKPILVNFLLQNTADGLS